MEGSNNSDGEKKQGKGTPTATETYLEVFCKEQSFALETVKLWNEKALIEELEAKGYTGARQGNVVAAWKQAQALESQDRQIYHFISTNWKGLRHPDTITACGTVPLVGRTHDLKVLEHEVQTKVLPFRPCDPTDYRYPIIGGECGIGKTRLACELAKKFMQDPLVPTVYVYVRLPARCKAEDVPKRILSEYASGISPKANLKQAMEGIAKHIRGTHLTADTPVRIIVHLDEFQTLHREEFSNLMSDLVAYSADVARKEAQIEFVPILSGVPVGVFVNRIIPNDENNTSKARCYILVPSSLTYAQLLRFLKLILQSKGYSKDKLELVLLHPSIRRLMAGFAGVPRLVEVLVDIMERHVDLDIGKLFPLLLQRYTTKYEPEKFQQFLSLEDVPHSQSCSLTLPEGDKALRCMVELAILQDVVPETTQLNGIGKTLQDAEALGCVELETVRRNKNMREVRVKIPLVGIAAINQHVVVIDPTFLDKTVKWEWQRWEEFNADFVKLLVNAKMHTGITTITLGDLFNGALVSPSAKRITVTLQPITVVTASQKLEYGADLRRVQLSNDEEIDITNGGYLVINGTSATAADSILVFKEQDKRVILHIQSKFTEATETITVDEFLHEEEKATGTDYIVGKKEDKCSEVDVFMLLSNRLEKPDHSHCTFAELMASDHGNNYIVVTHSNFEDFFSRTFSDFGLLYEEEYSSFIQWPKVNRCSVDDLRAAFEQTGSVKDETYHVGSWCFEQFVEMDEDTIKVECYCINSDTNEVSNPTWAEVFVEKDDHDYYLTINHSGVCCNYLPQVSKCWNSILSCLQKQLETNEHKRKVGDLKKDLVGSILDVKDDDGKGIEDKSGEGQRAPKKQKTNCFSGKIFYVSRSLSAVKKLQHEIQSNGGKITESMTDADYYIASTDYQLQYSRRDASKSNVPMLNEGFVWDSISQDSLQEKQRYRLE